MNACRRGRCRTVMIVFVRSSSLLQSHHTTSVLLKLAQIVLLHRHRLLLRFTRMRWRRRCHLVIRDDFVDEHDDDDGADDESV